MKLLVLNHKMNIEYSVLDNYIDELSNIKNNNIKLVVCPSDIYLLKFKEKGFTIGGQNVSFDKKGNYTGEVSAEQLKSIGADYCIVGHSERRKYFDEDDNTINRKIKLLLDNDIDPILCVGETLEQKNSGVTKQIIVDQIAKALDGVRKDKIENVIIAYEPVWSIGSGMIPTIDELQNIILFIKDSLKKVDCNIKVLYGGSVNEENISYLNNIDKLDGFLLGSVSLDTKRMSNLTYKL
ncbi:MAG: triose-phosphate isomerase [Bacilli bacterium]